MFRVHLHWLIGMHGVVVRRPMQNMHFEITITIAFDKDGDYMMKFVCSPFNWDVTKLPIPLKMQCIAWCSLNNFHEIFSSWNLVLGWRGWDLACLILHTCTNNNIWNFNGKCCVLHQHNGQWHCHYEQFICSENLSPLLITDAIDVKQKCTMAVVAFVCALARAVRAQHMTNPIYFETFSTTWYVVVVRCVKTASPNEMNWEKLIRNKSNSNLLLIANLNQCSSICILPTPSSATSKFQFNKNLIKHFTRGQQTHHLMPKTETAGNKTYLLIVDNFITISLLHSFM